MQEGESQSTLFGDSDNDNNDYAGSSGSDYDDDGSSVSAKATPSVVSRHRYLDLVSDDERDTSTNKRDRIVDHSTLKDNQNDDYVVLKQERKTCTTQTLVSSAPSATKRRKVAAAPKPGYGCKKKFQRGVCKDPLWGTDGYCQKHDPNGKFVAL